IDGELFMSKSPGVPHQRASMKVTSLFLSYLGEHLVGELLATPGVILSDIDAVIPDLVFVRHERMREVISGDRIIAAPDIVVEILSPGPENRRRDRVAKRQLYAKFGVKEYWILDLETKSIEIYVLKDRVLDLWATLGVNDLMRSTILAGFDAPVPAIFGTV